MHLNIVIRSHRASGPSELRVELGESENGPAALIELDVGEQAYEAGHDETDGDYLEQCKHVRK